MTPCPLLKHFAKLRDPRLNRRKRHLLADILVIAICAVIAGANTWPQIENFAKRRRDWLKQFLALPNGIPSHDTFERLFARLDPQAFQRCFLAWVQSWQEAVGGPHAESSVPRLEPDRPAARQGVVGGKGRGGGHRLADGSVAARPGSGRLIGGGLRHHAP
jgi:hypothetical protein